MESILKSGKPKRPMGLVGTPVVYTFTLRLKALDHKIFMGQPSDEVQGPSVSHGHGPWP